MYVSDTRGVNHPFLVETEDASLPFPVRRVGGRGGLSSADGRQSVMFHPQTRRERGMVKC